MRQRNCVCEGTYIQGRTQKPSRCSNTKRATNTTIRNSQNGIEMSTTTVAQMHPTPAHTTRLLSAVTEYGRAIRQHERYLHLAGHADDAQAAAKLADVYFLEIEAELTDASLKAAS